MVVTVACAAALVACGAASAQVKPEPRLPSHDPFYTYTGSRPLSEITPGTVLKKRAVTVEIASLTVPYTAEQVLYRTTGELGQPAVTVTTIIEPVGSPLGQRSSPTRASTTRWAPNATRPTPCAAATRATPTRRPRPRSSQGT